MKGDEEIELPGYKFFSHNRQDLHIRARSGLGGVGVFVKNSILQTHAVSILDKSLDGILWVRLDNKQDRSDRLNICVCYLPPHGSSRHVDAAEFFEELHAQIVSYQNQGEFLLMGDYNSRVGDRQEFIEGVDV